MDLFYFIMGVAVGVMFMGFCFSRSMNRFAESIQTMSVAIHKMAEMGYLDE